jgi:hypothetical protein
MGAPSVTGLGRTRTIAAVVLALLALGAAGCGGGDSGGRLSKGDYEKQVRSALTDYVRALSPLQGGNQASGQILADVGRAQVTLSAAAARLRKLKPPKDAETDNTKLATAIGGLAGVFGSLKQALASNNVAKAQATARAYQNSTQSRQLTEAISDLKKKGYDLTGSGAS